METEPETAALMKATMQSEVNEHRQLLLALFRLSHSRQAHAVMTESQDLTKWVMKYLENIP